MTTGASVPTIRPWHLLANLAVFCAVAFAVTAFFGPTPLLTVVQAGRPALEQVCWGIGIGLAVSASVHLAVLGLPFLTSFQDQMLQLGARLDLRGLNPLWISLCAGIGEEALARGALQPLLGIWWTSVIFTLLHYQTGQFRSMNWQKLGYAGIVFLASLGLGEIFIQWGLIAAACTHATMDLVGLLLITRMYPRRASQRSLAGEPPV